MAMVGIKSKNIPEIVIFAGPNGSGKTTITEAVIGDSTAFAGEYINADDIARSLEAEILDYRTRNLQAAQIAEQRRLAALHDRKTFAFETVMSTPEKVALMTQAKALGYRIALFFVTTRDPRINVDRVASRVASGGHPVEPEAIRRRYQNTMNLLACAFEKADRATILDNSERAAIRVVAKKLGEHFEFPAESGMLPWVAEKLVTPSMQRLFSRQLLTHTLNSGRPVRMAQAAHGEDYHGVVLHVTNYHVLQEVRDELLLHDRQLAATIVFTPTQMQTIRYRYQYGKILTSSRP